MHTDCRVLWRERDRAASLSRAEKPRSPAASLSWGARPDPDLDKLLLLLWAHYIQAGPHLLRTGLLQVVGYLLRNTKERVLLISAKNRMFADAKGKWLDRLPSSLGGLARASGRLL